MSEHTVQRARHLGEIERLDEQARVSDLPPAAAPHEAPKLRLEGASLPGRLLLQGAERSEVTLSVDDLFHGGRPEGADQLLLQVCDAHVEPESFHIGASEVGADAGPLETAPEVALLCGITETGQPDVQSPRAKALQESSDGLRAPDRHDGDALSFEIPATALSQRFERALVADPFNEHDRTCEGGFRLARCLDAHACSVECARGSHKTPL